MRKVPDYAQLVTSIIEAFQKGDSISHNELTATVTILHRVIADIGKVPRQEIDRLRGAVEKYVVFMHQILLSVAECLLDQHECGESRKR